MLLLVILLISLTWKTHIFLLFWSGKVELSNPKAELRILEVFYHKIYKVKHWDYSILSLYRSPALGDQYRFDVLTSYHLLCCKWFSNASNPLLLLLWNDYWVKKFIFAWQIFPSNEKIENINDQYWTLRAEEVGDILFILHHCYINVLWSSENVLQAF